MAVADGGGSGQNRLPIQSSRSAVMLSLALGNEPELLVLDDPTGT